jgi:hypothetical protein
LGSFVRDWCHKHLKPLPSDTDVSFETWINQTPYPEGRRKQLRATYAKFHSNPFDILSNRVAGNKCFIKDECYPSYKNLRGIFSRTDIFKCEVGRFFKCIEHAVYSLPSFIKHIPVASRAKYVFDKLHGEGRKYMATDYTSFESHFTRFMFRTVEDQVYKYMTQLLPEKAYFNKLLNVIYGRNRLYFKDITAEISARRMSGEMNTSLGNGLANYLVFLFIQHKLGNTDYDCVIEGDDCLGAFRGKYPTTEDYKRLGFTVKIEQHKDLRKASFCGLIFSDNYVVVTDPIKVIMKFGWASSKYWRCGDGTRLQLLRSKALSVAHQYPGHPILSAMSRCYLRLTEGHKWKFDGNNYEYLRFKEMLDLKFNFAVEERTRTLVEEVFKIPRQSQLSLEEYFDSMTKIEPIWHPIIYDFVQPDQFHYDQTYVYPKDLMGEGVVTLRVPRQRKLFFRHAAKED